MRDQGGLEVARRSRRATRTRAPSRRRSASAARTLTASYELPFMKHAPIGPTIAVGDVRPDGTVFVHTHNQNPQALRGQIAMMLGTPVDNVVVRIYAGPGHYGRSNGGNAGAEDEAVLLSTGRRPARPRAVDAARGPAVVHAVAGRILRHPHRARCAAGRSPPIDAEPLHAGHAGRSAGRRDPRGTADAARAGRPTPTRSVRR